MLTPRSRFGHQRTLGEHRERVQCVKMFANCPAYSQFPLYLWAAKLAKGDGGLIEHKLCYCFT